MEDTSTDPLAGTPVADHRRYDELLERCRAHDPLPTAVVQPTDELSVRAARTAADAGLVVPILVGPARAIRAAASGFNAASRRRISGSRTNVSPIP